MWHFGERPPQIEGSAFEADKDALHGLSQNLSQICSQVNGFAAALALFVYCGKQIEFFQGAVNGDTTHLFGHWRFIAARDGALRLSDFNDALEGANGYLKAAFGDEVQKVKPSPDDLLKQYFPNFAGVRNSAAHTSLKTKNSKQIEAHSTTEYKLGGINARAKSILVGEGLHNQTYYGLWKKEPVSYDLTQQSLKRLEEIKNALFSRIPKSYPAQKESK